MDRAYIYHSFTRTLCSECGELVNGKIVYDEKNVFIIKNCVKCGEQIELLEENTEYYLSKYKYDKRGTKNNIQTKHIKGCPFDCGICENHDQHTCIGLIEVTKRCNLNCPMCYAKSGQEEDVPFEKIEKMMNFYMEVEDGKAEILQISGGEPTLHKNIIEIIQMAVNKKFKYIMLNTNGVRIAEDEDFVKELSKFKGGFEIYLQFDGLDKNVLSKLRNSDLGKIKKQALDNLNKYNIPTTLVATIEKDVNDHMCGEILVYAMKNPCVRGVNFQPLSYYGDEKPTKDRVTLSGILNRIEKQTSNLLFVKDFIPLPCNVERVAITYLFKDKKGFIPITRNNDLSVFKDVIGSTFAFTVEDVLKDFNDDSKIFKINGCCDLIVDLKRYLPKNFIFKSKEEKIKFVDENTFRISVSSFIDKYNFDMKSMQKECVHIITPDLKRVPFSSYNMFHREG